MIARFARLFSIALLATALGCASAPSRFYTLRSTATAGGGPPSTTSVAVGPVSIPSSVDRPEMVVQTAPNRVEIDEFNRWAAPLGDAIARAVAEDLSKILGTPRVAVAPLTNFDPAYRVAIEVQRFDSIPGEAVDLEAVWVVTKTAGGESTSGRTTARVAATGPDYDALAAAHSQALARLSDDVAAAIRAFAAQPAPRKR